MAKSGLKRLYHIPILSKALDILELLQAEDEPLSLEALYQRTRISKTSVYRILKTFVHRGYVAQTENGLYRLATRPRKIRFGFGGQSEDLPFSQAVTESLRAAAASSGVDLMILDNHYDAATAIRNAEQFVASRVDLVIEFQIEQQVAPIVADKIADAGIPLIAVEIPHPHAIFFGVNNYRAGFEAASILPSMRGNAGAAKHRGSSAWILKKPARWSRAASPARLKAYVLCCPTCRSKPSCAWTDAGFATGATS